jgi:hypothetical protein
MMKPIMKKFRADLLMQLGQLEEAVSLLTPSGEAS